MADRLGRVCLLVLCLLWGMPAAGESFDPIVEIRFEGNDVTKPVILRQEMVVREGDPADPGKIERSRQNIMNLGLFEKVDAELSDVEGGKLLVIRVREKFYILPLPLLERNAEGDIRWGAELRFDNLFGYNQRLNIKNETTDVADGNIKRKNEISYSINRIPGTRYGFKANASQETSVDEIENLDGASGDYERLSRSASATLQRWLRKDAPSQGWRGDVGIAWSRSAYDYLRGDEGLVGADVRNVELRVGVQYTALERFTFDRGGQQYGVDVDISAPSLGADRDYQRVRGYWREYLRFGDERATNLNYQIKAGYARGADPDATFFALGSSDTLRGYERDSVRGNAYVVANVEYLKPFPGSQRVRGVLFGDLGNAYPADDIDLFDLKQSVGTGLRWKITFLVDVDLRVDVAYAVDDGTYKVYAGSSHTF